MKIDKIDIEWIRKKLNDFYSTDFESSEEDFRHRAIERRTRRMLRLIEKQKPKDLKLFVNTEINRLNYMREVESLENSIDEMKSLDEKTGNKIKVKYDALVEKIKAEDPEFWEERKRRINHTNFLLSKKITGSHKIAEQ